MLEEPEVQTSGATPPNPAYAKYDPMTLVELGQAMEEVRRVLDEAKEIKTKLEKEYDFICSVKIPPALEASGLKNFRLASGKGIRVQDEVYVSLPVERFATMKIWLQERGEDAIIKESINPSTLKAFVTGRIKDGKEYPAELVNVNIIPKARFF